MVQKLEFREVPCKCGYRYESHSPEYEIAYTKRSVVIAGLVFSDREIRRCKTCKTEMVIEKIEIDDELK